MITPTLQTKRLILRPFIKGDAQDVLNTWESDPDVAKYMFWTSHSDINKTIEWLASEKVMKKLGFQYVKDIRYECNEGKNIYDGKEYIIKF